MEGNKIKIIYVYDALCGWCYGFSKQIHALYDKYQDEFDFEVLSGGMITGERVGPVSKMAEYIKSAYKTVEELSGVKFGEAYLRRLDEGTMILDSEPPSIALSVFKSFKPKEAVPFCHDIQDAIHFEGRDPNENSLYRYLAVNYGIDPDEFEARMSIDKYRDAARYDFALARQLQVTGYPAVLLQSSDRSFYLIARGYTDLETLELRIDNVKKELSSSQGD